MATDATLDTTYGVFTITAGTGFYADLLAGATTVRLQDAAVGANGPTIGLLNLDSPGNTSGTFSGIVVNELDRPANRRRDGR